VAAGAELGLGGEIAVLGRAGRKQRGSGRCGRVRIVLSQKNRAAAAAVVRIWVQT
jgi:hypothetical protein